MRQFKLLSILLLIGLSHTNAKQSTATLGREVAAGEQQAFDITVITGIADNAIQLTISSNPNPSTDFLTLQMGSQKPIKSSVAYLCDSNGKLIELIRVESNQTVIPMKDRPGSLFFLRVINDQYELKTFKIIKK